MSATNDPSVGSNTQQTPVQVGQPQQTEAMQLNQSTHPNEEMVMVPARLLEQLVTVSASDLDQEVSVTVRADQRQALDEHLAANPIQQEQSAEPTEERATLTLGNLLRFQRIGAVFTDVRHVGAPHANV